MIAAVTVSQLILGVAFVIAGVLHFVAPKPYVSMMPRFFPRAWGKPLVLISGVFEVLGGVGVLVGPVRMWAGIGLIALLVAVFPANVQMLMNARRKNAKAMEQALLWIRLPLQAVLMWWVWTTTTTT